MTVIVAIETPAGVWMGGDRLATDTRDGLSSIDDRPKIDRIGPVLIGVAESYRVAQLLRYTLAMPVIPAELDPDRWAAIDLSDAIRAAMEAGGMPMEAGSGPCALIAVAGRCYEIQDDYSVLRTTSGEYGIGSGRHVAYGSLHSTRFWADPEARIHAALEAASEHVVSCAGPFDVVWQERG